MTDSDTAFLTQPNEILSRFESLISSGGPADIAIAFWGRGAIESLGLDRASKGTRILLNAKSGACNPATLELLLALMKRGTLRVRSSDSLHAKVVLTASEVLVGSANASANGLGFQGTQLKGWDEACVSVRSRKAIAAAKTWYESRWTDASTYDLSKEVVEAARRAWNQRRKHLVSAGLQSTESDVIDLLEGRSVYVAMTDSETGFEIDKVRTLARKQGKPESFDDFYENWPSMPRDAILLNLYPRTKSIEDGIEDDGFWLSPEDPSRSSFEAKTGSRIFPVIQVRDTASEPRLAGLNIDVKSVREAAASLAKLRGPRGLPELSKKFKEVKVKRCTDWCMSLADFVRICNLAEIPAPIVTARASTVG